MRDNTNFGEEAEYGSHKEDRLKLNKKNSLFNSRTVFTQWATTSGSGQAHEDHIEWSNFTESLHFDVLPWNRKTFGENI